MSKKKRQGDTWIKSGWVHDHNLNAMVGKGWTFHQMVHLRFDGGCGPTNPGGIPTFGWQLYSVAPDRGFIIEEADGVCEGHPWQERTNNTAEWAGVCDALEWMRRHKVAAHKILIIGDSQLVLNQLSSRWRAKKEWLARARDEAWDHLRHVCVLSYAVKWVSRVHNAHCDSLANEAFMKHRDNPAVMESN